ncbi:MAG: hypothetical protein IH596_06600 [Bacteroidales bacterium]|nr:hypothetical protein [Bacteroidales bacterium]
MIDRLKNSVVPIFHDDNSCFLVIRKTDLPEAGKRMGVLAKEVRIKTKHISHLVDLERFLKFGCWDYIASEEERQMAIKLIYRYLPDNMITSELIDPLLSEERKEHESLLP